jgi:transposase, IS30 family
MITAIAGLPIALGRSLNWEHGNGMAHHAGINLAVDLPIYCCAPHRPWQHGSHENTDGLLCRYYPKGSDVSGRSSSRALVPFA